MTGTEQPQSLIPGRPLWQQLAVAAGIGMLVAFIGPFNTFSDLDLPSRLVYWVSIVVLNTIQVTLIVSLLLNRWSHLAQHNQDPKIMYLVGSIGCLAAAIPATAEVFMLEQYFRPGAVPLEAIGELYFYIVVLSLIISFPMVHFSWAKPKSAPLPEEATLAPAPMPTPEAAPAQEARQSFQQRLPQALRGTLYLVRSEDHYLRVFTEKGDDLILMRLSDAVQELTAEGLEGLQVHRSAWVAKAGVTGHRRENRKVILKLQGDLEQPVSKTYLAQVKEAGWLD